MQPQTKKAINDRLDCVKERLLVRRTLTLKRDTAISRARSRFEEAERRAREEHDEEIDLLTSELDTLASELAPLVRRNAADLFPDGAKSGQVAGMLVELTAQDAELVLELAEGEKEKHFAKRFHDERPDLVRHEYKLDRRGIKAACDQGDDLSGHGIGFRERPDKLTLRVPEDRDNKIQATG